MCFTYADRTGNANYIHKMADLPDVEPTGCVDVEMWNQLCRLSTEKYRYSECCQHRLSVIYIFVESMFKINNSGWKIGQNTQITK